MARTYVIGLPVVLTLHDDGSVTASVDLSEADDLWDASTPDGQLPTEQPALDNRLRLDMDLISAAIRQRRIVVDGDA